jgi:hypothetical protein
LDPIDDEDDARWCVRLVRGVCSDWWPFCTLLEKVLQSFRPEAVALAVCSMGGTCAKLEGSCGVGVDC